MIARRIVVSLVCLACLLVPVATLGSEADAIALSENIRRRHMPFGIVVDPIFASPDSDEIVGYTHCGDSAIWTGHYLAAEAFRYNVTRSEQALENVKAAIRGVASLLNVTGTNLLARCLVPMNSPYALAIIQEEGRHGVYQNTQFGYYWIGNTSRDQYSGVFFGLGVAYDLVDDPEVRGAITPLVTLLLDFLRGHNWFVVMPSGAISTTFVGRAEQQLSFLQIGRQVNSSRFSSTYDAYRLWLAAQTIMPVSFDTLSDASYFKFNLDSINLFNLIRLEHSSFAAIYREAYSVLRHHTADQGNLFFNLIDRGLNGSNEIRDAASRQMLDDWLLRPRRDVSVDLRGLYRTCGAEDQACDPIPVAKRVCTDFLWQRSPYQLVGLGTGRIETAGIDYILPYWMARHYGVVE